MSIPMVLYWAIATLGLAALAGGFLGRVHPLGDSLAVFRSQIALLGAVWSVVGLAFGLSSGWLLLPCTAAFATVAHAHLRPERCRDVPVVHYQKNMSYRMRSTAALAADIREVAPDILTLQEVTEANAVLLDQLSDILPYRHSCSFEAVGAVALAARWPIIDGSAAFNAYGMAAARVEAPNGPLWVVSVHLHWPWPARPSQSAQVAGILAALEKIDGPVVLGGDFNMVRWSHVVRRIARAIGAEPGGRVRPSFRLRRVTTLPIDQILVPRGQRGASESRPTAGSDHRGLVVRF